MQARGPVARKSETARPLHHFDSATARPSALHFPPLQCALMAARQAKLAARVCVHTARQAKLAACVCVHTVCSLRCRRLFKSSRLLSIRKIKRLSSIVASVMGADYANRRARECGVRQVRAVCHSRRLWTCPHSLRQSALFSNEPLVFELYVNK